MSTVLTLPRMFTDAFGDSRFDETEVPMVLKNHAPPAAPFLISAPCQADQFVHFTLPARWHGEAHPTPYACLVICLSGSFRFIGSAGDEYIMRPGDRLIDENTTGKGHSTEVLSDIPVDGLIVRIRH